MIVGAPGSPSRHFAPLPLQPRGDQPPPVVISEVRPIPPHRRIPDRDVDRGRHVHVVLLLREVPLDLVDDLPPLLEVGGAALAHEEVVEHGVVDVAPVAGLAGVVLAEEEAVRLEEGREGPERKRVELAEAARGLVGAVLLLVEPGVDARPSARAR